MILEPSLQLHTLKENPLILSLNQLLAKARNEIGFEKLCIYVRSYCPLQTGL